MNNLSLFSAPEDGEVTLCDVDGRIHSMNYEYANVSAFTTSVENYPQIHISLSCLHTYSTRDEARSLFLPVQEPLLKRLIQVYQEQGSKQVLHTTAQFGPRLIKDFASFTLAILQGIDALKRRLFSNPNTVALIADISQTRSWIHSPIRSLAWHLYHTKVAVATSDDSVRIYSKDTNLIPVLKSKQQRNITCLAWRPLSNSEIAVGCEDGIFIWNVEPTSVVTRPSINNATILRRVHHTPVVSLEWNRQGDILASAAACHSTILLWNVELDETSSLKIPGGRGNALLKWSPTGSKLFSCTTGLIFRMWECRYWQSERWNLLSGRVQAALLVSSELIFASGSKNSPNQAMPMYDVAKVDIDGLIVGGIVQNMEWDRKGDYLAVLFRDTDYVALFRVIARPVLQLSPSCLIAGCPEERPLCVAFQKNFEYGACLSIGWSNGRVQYFPIIYSCLSSSPISNSFSKVRSLSLFN